MRWTPHGYQLTAISRLIVNPRSGLFLDAGLGKTSTSLAAIKILTNAEKIDGVLLVAPLRVCYSVWPNEIKKWDNFRGMSCAILHGATKSDLFGEQKTIYLINPEGLPWLRSELIAGLRAGKKLPFNCLWIDESTKFKNPKSKRFKIISELLPLFKRSHIMTGTPAPKTLLDLWSQIFILDRGDTLGKSFYQYRNKFFKAEDWNKYNWRLRPDADQKIHKLIAPVVLEMQAKDYLELPDQIFNNILIDLPPKILADYKRFEHELFIAIGDDEIIAAQAAQMSLKCHQIANGSVYEDPPPTATDEEKKQFIKTRSALFVHDEKIKALIDLVDELNGKPILIAYKFKHDLAAIKKIYPDTPHIGSGVTPEQTDQIVAKWNKGEIPILLGHPAAMGHGLNMQAAGNDVCWFSLTWDLEEYLQFNARIYRQGVSGSVRVHHLIANSTIDQAMLLRLGERTKQQIELRDAIKQYQRNCENC